MEQKPPILGSVDEEIDRNGALSLDDSLSTFVFASCPLEVWDRIFSFMNLTHIVQFTRKTSKSIYNWSCDALTEIEAQNTVCSHLALQRPNLRTVSLPFGFIGCQDEIDWFNFGGNQLLTLELGVHPRFNLDLLVSRAPSLRRLLMGSEVTLASNSWDFLPRGLVELSLRMVRRFNPSNAQLHQPLLASLFKGLPTSLKKFTLMHTQSGLDSQMAFAAAPLSISSRSAVPSFIDFLINCAPILNQLEHLQLPDALDLILCIEADKSDFLHEEEKESPTDHSWLIPKHLCLLKNLTYLSCRAVYWELESDAKQALKRSNLFKHAFTSIPLLTTASNSSHYATSSTNVRDLRNWTLTDLAPKLQHLCTQQSKLKEDEHHLWSTETEYLENQEEIAELQARRSANSAGLSQPPSTQLKTTFDKVFPSSLTSLHVLDKDEVTWPLEAKLAYEESDPKVWSLPAQLCYLSLPSIENLGYRKHNHHALKSLSLTHCTSFEALEQNFGRIASLCPELAHLNVEGLDVPGHHHIVRGEIGFSTELKASWRDSLKTICPSLSWLTIYDCALLLPSSPSTSSGPLEKPSHPSRFGDDMEAHSRYVPSLFCFGPGVVSYIPSAFRRKSLTQASPEQVMRWETDYERVVEEMRIMALNWHFVPCDTSKIEHPSAIYGYFVRLEEQLLKKGATSETCDPRQLRFASRLLRVHGLASSAYRYIREFTSEFAYSIDMAALCCAFGLVKQRSKKSPSSMTLSASPNIPIVPTSDAIDHRVINATLAQVRLSMSSETVRTWIWPWDNWIQSPLLERLLQTMMHYNVELNEVDDLKRSLLHRLIASRHVRGAACLFALKVEPHRFYIDIDQEDVYGVSARREALQSGHHELVALCKQRTAAEAHLPSPKAQPSATAPSTPTHSHAGGSNTSSPSSRLASPPSAFSHASSNKSPTASPNFGTLPQHAPATAFKPSNNQIAPPSSSTSPSSSLPFATVSTATTSSEPRDKTSKKRRDQAMALWDETRQ